MNIIGISAFYHESSCCLLQDGQLIAAASEERFSRVKHDPRLPIEAFRYCLDFAGLHPGEIDCIAYYENPVKKLSRQLWAGTLETRPGNLLWLDPDTPLQAIKEGLGYAGPIYTFDHHLSHAASAFYYSGFEDAAVLTVDGVGEWDTTSFGRGNGSTVEILQTVEFPHSFGLLYAALTSYLGFRVNNGEYKVMGLAAHGKPALRHIIDELVTRLPGGSFELNMEYFDFVRGDRMFSSKLTDLLEHAPRNPKDPITPFHADVACSLQALLEEILLEKVQHLSKITGSKNLCLAGGVALNAVANGRIRREGPFENLFIQPAAGDSGACLGAASLAYVQRTGERPDRKPLRRLFLGPRAKDGEITRLLENAGIKGKRYSNHSDELLRNVALRLADNQLVGWFQGRMEFGPRALGNRSILANPMDPNVKSRLNQVIKRREVFRPFAPSVLADHASEHFALKAPAPFMIETCQVTSPLPLHAVTHKDGSARPQTVAKADNPRFAGLLEAFFEITGCPILLNTSFNVAGQPIVRTPQEALLTMALSGLDVLVLEDTLIIRADLPAEWLTAIQNEPLVFPAAPPTENATTPNLYTFV